MYNVVCEAVSERRESTKRKRKWSFIDTGKQLI
jgi:hypothetical protein